MVNVGRAKWTSFEKSRAIKVSDFEASLLNTLGYAKIVYSQRILLVARDGQKIVLELETLTHYCL